MNAGLVAALALLTYFLGYRFYSKFIARKVFNLGNSNKNKLTPAHEFRDNKDFVPTKKFVLFGHHYASIAGLAPMLGPAVAVIWGWLPAVVWVVLGSLLIGCVHDMSSLVLSVRNKGQGIGQIAEKYLSKRAQYLMHGIIFFLVSLGMGIFVFVIAFMFSPAKDAETSGVHFPQAVIPSFGIMLIAALLGYLNFKKNIGWKILGPLGFLSLIILIFAGQNESLLSFLNLNNYDLAPNVFGWSLILLAYAFLASILPVWSLLQPRDFINSLLLYLGLILLFVALFISQPEFVAPAVNLHPVGAPSLFPFVFIIIACGAASGFHSLVSSGTTSKQLNKESDARLIGYGGMIGESLLGLVAILATTAGVINTEAWNLKYATWDSIQGLGPKIAGFVGGCAKFLEVFGFDNYTSRSFISVVVVSYALTSLDSATRLLRYNIEEVVKIKSKNLSALFASLLAVVSIGFFAFYEINGKPAGVALLRLFGTTNQMLAGLALMVVSLYLLVKNLKKKYYLITAIPMSLLLITTLWAMLINMRKFLMQEEYLLFGISAILLGMCIWLIVEGVMAAYRVVYARKKQTSTNMRDTGRWNWQGSSS